MTQPQPQQQSNNMDKLTLQQQAAAQEGFAPIEEDVWDVWMRAHPVPQVKEIPRHYLTVMYDRKQAEQCVDIYEEAYGPSRVVLCQANKRYYIVPETKKTKRGMAVW